MALVNKELVVIEPALVKALLGGQWPKDPRGFCFEAVDCFIVEENRLIPYDAPDGNPVPGPDFQLIMIPFSY